MVESLQGASDKPKLIFYKLLVITKGYFGGLFYCIVVNFTILIWNDLMARQPSYVTTKEFNAFKKQLSKEYKAISSDIKKALKSLGVVHKKALKSVGVTAKPAKKARKKVSE